MTYIAQTPCKKRNVQYFYALKETSKDRKIQTELSWELQIIWNIKGVKRAIFHLKDVQIERKWSENRI